MDIKTLNIQDPLEKMRKNTVNVSSVEEYFALPKSKRERYGWYLTPYALPCDFIDPTVKGWDYFHKRIRKEYPIQGFIREWFLSIDNPAYWLCIKTKYRYRDFKYSIKNFFKPPAPRFHKVWPRSKYMDISEAIRLTNFALILDFWYEEIVDGIVDWNATVEHKDFYEWIEKAVQYIEVGRKIIENQLDGALESRNYSACSIFEKVLYDKDTEVLNEMVKRREYFWT